MTTAYGPEWPTERYRVLATGTAARWAGREDQIPNPPPGPAIIGHTRLFPHSLDLSYDMPKFSAVPPTPPTEGMWEEMAFPAGQGVARIRDVRPAGDIINEMMTDARTLLETAQD